MNGSNYKNTLISLANHTYYVIIHLTIKLNVKRRRISLGMQDTLRALADPTRREILNLLKKSRLSAGEIGDHFSISGAAVSRHLSVLKEADLIRDEREGKFIYYELNTTVLEEIMLWITELKGGNDHDQTT